MPSTPELNSPEYHQGKRRLRLRNFVFVYDQFGSVSEIAMGPREKKRLLPDIDEAFLEKRKQLMTWHPGMECVTARGKNLQKVKQTFPNLNWGSAQISRIQTYPQKTEDIQPPLKASTTPSSSS